MKHRTYSFADLAFTLIHPAIGQLSIQGEGAGDIVFSMANDVSTHETANDGTVMTSKITSYSGTVTISVQQTSEANKWLTKLYNYLIEAPSNEWAGISCMATSQSMGITYEGKHMSIQKAPDENFGQQGQMVSWVFLASELRRY